MLVRFKTGQTDLNSQQARSRPALCTSNDRRVSQAERRVRGRLFSRGREEDGGAAAWPYPPVIFTGSTCTPFFIIIMIQIKTQHVNTFTYPTFQRSYSKHIIIYEHMKSSKT